MAKVLKPSIKVIGVQGETSLALYDALKTGGIVRCRVGTTLAEGLAGNAYKEILPFLQEVVDEMVLVSEEEIARGMRWPILTGGQVVEAARAVGVAALLAEKFTLPPGPTLFVVRGGNVDAAVLREVVAG